MLLLVGVVRGKSDFSISRVVDVERGVAGVLLVEFFVGRELRGAFL